MSCITKHKNKKTGVIYAYKSESYWDSDKKQARNKKTYIGKVNPITNEIIPAKTKCPQCSILTAQVQVIGPTQILKHIIKKTKLDKIIPECFPTHGEHILAMAQYLVI